MSTHHFSGEIIHDCVKKSSIFPIYQKWFAPTLTLQDYFSYVAFIQSRCKFTSILYKSTKFYSLVIDLCKPEEEIFSDFTKDTQYQIRRSANDDFIYIVGLRDFINHFNSFAKNVGLAPVSQKKIKRLEECSIVTCCKCGEYDVIYHFYVVDRDLKIARLLYSSRMEANDDISKAEICRSNCFLHYQDMLLFQNQGIQRYDFGGIAFHTSDLKK